MTLYNTLIRSNTSNVDSSQFHDWSKLILTSRMRDSAGVLYIKKKQALKQNVVYEFKCDCVMQIMYRLHVPSCPSACRGTQTFRY